jgi:hypothetical protein
MACQLRMDVRDESGKHLSRGFGIGGRTRPVLVGRSSSPARERHGPGNRSANKPMFS